MSSNPQSDDGRQGNGPLSKIVDVLVGNDGGKSPDKGPRGWEQPLEEQQDEPENEPTSRNADER